MLKILYVLMSVAALSVFVNANIKLAYANVLPGDSKNFTLKALNNSVESSFASITNGSDNVENSNRTTFSSSSLSTIMKEIWTKQAQLNASAKDKLQAVRIAVTQLCDESMLFAGRNAYMTAKVKLMKRYLNGTDTIKHAAANNVLNLQHFVQLVDDLLSADDDEHAMENMLMKSLIEKYKLIKLQSDVQIDVLQAVKVWQNDVHKQLVEVSSV
uniref:Uncharacterized protein n=1 Tax=Glossina palpalis gambiensis TaxID=67801 RepID=A0A1B0BA69_9MUSC